MKNGQKVNPNGQKVNPNEEKVNPNEEKVNPNEEKVNPFVNLNICTFLKVEFFYFFHEFRI